MGSRKNKNKVKLKKPTITKFIANMKKAIKSHFHLMESPSFFPRRRESGLSVGTYLHPHLHLPVIHPRAIIFPLIRPSFFNFSRTTLHGQAFKPYFVVVLILHTYVSVLYINTSITIASLFLSHFLYFLKLFISYNHSESKPHHHTQVA